jgi:hypothetical protein
MSSDVTEERLDPEIAGLLHCERQQPLLVADRRAAMLRRLEHAAIATAAGAALTLGAEGVASVVTGSAKRAATWGVGAKLGLASAIFLAGGAIGSLVTWNATPRAAPEVAVVAPPPAPERPTAPSPVEPLPGDPAIPAVSVDSLPRVAPTAAPRASAGLAPAAPSSSTPARSTSLAEEQRLLDTARAAIARQAFGAALTALAEHEIRYPGGKLAEERELLYVQALAGAGDTEKARARAAAFAEKFPGSIFLPAVRAASSTKEP